MPRSSAGTGERSEPGQQAPREHPAQSGWHFAYWGCEFLGTLVLVLGGISAVVLDFGSGSPVARILASHSLRLLLTGLLFAGCGSLVAISPIGRRSGAHLNPSIPVAFFCHRHMHFGDAVGYIVAQCLGGVAGAEAIRVLWRARAMSVGDGRTLPGPWVSAPEAVGIEALMTALLVLVVFAFVSSGRTARWTPLAVWIVVAILVWRGAPYTGTSLKLDGLLDLPRRSSGGCLRCRGAVAARAASDLDSEAVSRRPLSECVPILAAGCGLTPVRSGPPGVGSDSIGRPDRPGEIHVDGERSDVVRAVSHHLE
jgi:aquaporin Z